MSENQQIQTVVVYLSDGTQGVFTGPKLVDHGDTRTVEDIMFSEPRDLPEGFSIGAIDETNKEQNK